MVLAESCMVHVKPDAELEKVHDGVGRDGIVTSQKYKRASIKPMTSTVKYS